MRYQRPAAGRKRSLQDDASSVWSCRTALSAEEEFAHESIYDKEEQVNLFEAIAQPSSMNLWLLQAIYHARQVMSATVRVLADSPTWRRLNVGAAKADAMAKGFFRRAGESFTKASTTRRSK